MKTAENNTSSKTKADHVETMRNDLPPTTELYQWPLSVSENDRLRDLVSVDFLALGVRSFFFTRNKEFCETCQAPEDLLDFFTMAVRQHGKDALLQSLCAGRHGPPVEHQIRCLQCAEPRGGMGYCTSSFGWFREFVKPGTKHLVSNLIDSHGEESEFLVQAFRGILKSDNE